MINNFINLNNSEKFKNIRQGVSTDICIFCLEKEWKKRRINVGDLKYEMRGRLEYQPIFFIRKHGQDTCICLECLKEQNELANEYIKETKAIYNRNMGIVETPIETEEVIETDEVATTGEVLSNDTKNEMEVSEEIEDKKDKTKNKKKNKK